MNFREMEKVLRRSRNAIKGTFALTYHIPTAAAVGSEDGGYVTVDTLKAMPRAPVALAAATLTLSAALHHDTTVKVDRAAGSTITLPASSGSGFRGRVHVGTAITSVGLVLQVANATDVMQGKAIIAQDAADTVVQFDTAASSDTITLNGTTTGGAAAGDWIEFEDIATGFWRVLVVATGSSTEATPFSAAVA